MGNIKFIEIKMADKPKELKTLAEYQEIIKSDKLVVIDFTATWCPPCQFIAPKFKELANRAEHANVEFCKIDVDANSQASEKAGIQCMPTFQYYKGGSMIDKLEGADFDTLVAKVQKHK